MAILSSGQTVFSLTHIEGITLVAGEEVDEVAGGARGMGVHRIGEVGDRAGGVYETGFAAGSLARKGACGGTRGTGNKVSLSTLWVPVKHRQPRLCKFFIHIKMY